jgi:hypothetical protein
MLRVPSHEIQSSVARACPEAGAKGRTGPRVWALIRDHHGRSAEQSMSLIKRPVQKKNPRPVTRMGVLR